MLTEPEWAQVHPLLQQAIADVKRYREAHGTSLAESLKPGLGDSARAKYRELTGYEETNVNAIWHHRLSDFGPPCSKCGELLRTPKASSCTACGASA